MVWRDDDPPINSGAPRLGYLHRRYHRLGRLVKRAKETNHRWFLMLVIECDKAEQEYERESRFIEALDFL